MLEVIATILLIIAVFGIILGAENWIYILIAIGTALFLYSMLHRGRI